MGGAAITHQKVKILSKLGEISLENTWLLDVE